MLFTLAWHTYHFHSGTQGAEVIHKNANICAAANRRRKKQYKTKRERNTFTHRNGENCVTKCGGARQREREIEREPIGAKK